MRKVLAILNILSGSLVLILVLSSFSLYLRIQEVYRDFGSSFNPTAYFVGSGLAIIFGITALIIGILLLKKPKAKLETWGWVVFCAVLIMVFLGWGIMVSSLMLPMFNLVNTIK